MTFYIKQGDTSPAILKQFLDASGTKANLTGATVKFSMAMVGGVVVINKATATVFVGTLPSGTAVTAADGWMRYAWLAGNTATAGEANAEFEVTFGDGTIETVPNHLYETIIITAQIA